jgi:hypothetical protein
MTNRNVTAGFHSVGDMYGTILVLKSVVSQLIAARPDGQELIAKFANFTTRLREDAIAAEDGGNVDASQLILEIAKGADETVTEITSMVADIQRRSQKGQLSGLT